MNFRSFLLIFVFAALDHASGAESWKNPQGTKEIKLIKEGSPAGDLQSLTVNGDPLKILANSNIRRENHGYGWMESAETTWLDNRLVVFQDDSGLAIVDADRNVILLNQLVTGYSESPDGEIWAAIRRRAVAKNQEALTGNEDDTLWFLDPRVLAEQAGDATEEAPFVHVPAVQVGGIALGPPVWSKDGKSITVTLYSNGNILADTYDVASRKRTASAARKNPSLSREQMLSLRFLPEVIREIDQALAADLAPRSSKNTPKSSGGVGTSSGREDSFDPASARQTGDDPNSSRLVLWVAAVIALIAAFTVVLKRRGKH